MIDFQKSIRCWPQEASSALESDLDIRDRLRTAGISIEGIEQAYNIRVWCIERIMDTLWLAITRQTPSERQVDMEYLAQLWLHGLRPFLAELHQPSDTHTEAELSILRYLLILAEADNLVGFLTNHESMARSHLKRSLVGLGIPARFEP